MFLSSAVEEIVEDIVGGDIFVVEVFYHPRADGAVEVQKHCSRTHGGGVGGNVDGGFVLGRIGGADNLSGGENPFCKPLHEAVINISFSHLTTSV